MSISICRTAFLILLATFATITRVVSLPNAPLPSSAPAITTPKTAPNTSQTLLIMGDSLSASYGFDFKQSWAHLLQQRLLQQQKNYQVVNASISGNTTQNGLTHLPKLLKTLRPAIVILALGGNDGLRGLAIKTIRENLTQMILLAQAQNSRVLLIGVRLPPNYGIEYTRKFMKLYQTLAKQYSVALVPELLKGISDNPKSGWMQEDGIHPTQAAQPQILKNVWPILNKMIEASY